MAVEIDAIQNGKSIGWADALLARLAAGSISTPNITVVGGIVILDTGGPRIDNSSGTVRFRNNANSADAPISAGAGTFSGITAFSKSDYGDVSTEDFYRIKIQDVGGTINDVGIGQPESGAIGFNTTPGGYFVFTSGTNGERFRIDGTTADVTFVGNAKFASTKGIDWTSQSSGVTATGSVVKVIGYNGVDIYAAVSTADFRFVNNESGVLLTIDGTQGDVTFKGDISLLNSTNPKSLYIYNTYTSGSVYERGFIKFASNALKIGCEHVGASQREVHISNIPTSNPGAGILWNDGGTLKIGT